jgi:hypothetical protein
MPIMREDMVYMWRTRNARVWPEPARIVPFEGFTEDRHFVRFGSAQAAAVLLLELGAANRLTSFDTEWYDGLFLRRLRARLFAEPEYTDPYQDSFDHVANTYQYDWIDLEAVLTIGKRRYYTLLLSVLKRIVADEGATGEIAKAALKAFRFSARQWETA